MLGKQCLERDAMVEQEGGLGADELLDEQSGRADFARRVLHSGLFLRRAVGLGAGVGVGGGQLGEVDGLVEMESLAGAVAWERHGAVLRGPTSRPRAHAARCAISASLPSRRSRRWRSSWLDISQAILLLPLCLSLTADQPMNALLCKANHTLR